MAPFLFPLLCLSELQHRVAKSYTESGELGAPSARSVQQHRWNQAARSSTPKPHQRIVKGVWFHQLVLLNFWQSGGLVRTACRYFEITGRTPVSRLVSPRYRVGLHSLAECIPALAGNFSQRLHVHSLHAVRRSSHIELHALSTAECSLPGVTNNERITIRNRVCAERS